MEKFKLNYKEETKEKEILAVLDITEISEFIDNNEIIIRQDSISFVDRHICSAFVRILKDLGVPFFCPGGQEGRYTLYLRKYFLSFKKIQTEIEIFEEVSSPRTITWVAE